MGWTNIRNTTVSQLGALILALVIFHVPAHAEATDLGPRDQRCRSEFNRFPDCTKRERRQINARFGLPPLETLYRSQPKGSDLIIASASFKLGGALALMFKKDRGGQPVAEIRRTSIGWNPLAPFRIHLSEQSWRAITAKARSIDTNLYEDDSICTGGAAFTLQIIDNAGTFRSRMGDVCGEHPGNWFFDELAEIALAELPICAGLAPEGYGDAWAGTKLYDCFMLGGKSDSAAEAYNFLEGASYWSTWNSDEAGTRARLAGNVEFIWPGQSLPKSSNDLAQILTEDRFEPYQLEPTSYWGEMGGDVIVQGSIKVRNQDVDGPEYRNFGTFRSVWVKQAEFGFRLSRFEARRR